MPEYSSSIMAVFFTVFRMIMVDDYYYSDIMQVNCKRNVKLFFFNFMLLEKMELLDKFYFDNLISYIFFGCINCAKRPTQLSPQWGKAADIPESWIHILISYWLMMSAIILLNLFIALMSDTFQVRLFLFVSCFVISKCPIFAIFPRL